MKKLKKLEEMKNYHLFKNTLGKVRKFQIKIREISQDLFSQTQKNCKNFHDKFSRISNLVNK